jgi:hypothetical protein
MRYPNKLSRILFRKLRDPPDSFVAHGTLAGNEGRHECELG